MVPDAPSQSGPWARGRVTPWMRQAPQSLAHPAGVFRFQTALEVAGTRGEGGQQQGAIGHGLGPRDAHGPEGLTGRQEPVLGK